MSEALIQTDSVSHKRNLSRVQRDEDELKELLKQAGVTQDETEEEAVEAEPDSSEPSEPQVQAESSSKQEEEPQAKAQEDEDLSAEEKNFKKRYGDLRRHTQEKEKEFQAQLDKLTSQLDAATKNELVLPKSEDEVEAWAKKYPDIAGIVEAIADKRLKLYVQQLSVRRQKQSCCLFIQTFKRFVLMMRFTLGQRSSLKLYKMLCMRTAKTLSRLHELLIFISQIKVLRLRRCLALIKQQHPQLKLKDGQHLTQMIHLSISLSRRQLRCLSRNTRSAWMRSLMLSALVSLFTMYQRNKLTILVS